MTKSRGIVAPTQRRPWTEADLADLRRHYPDMPTEALAVALGRSVSTVYQRARLLGLRKSDAYLAGPDACRLRRGDNVGAAFRFDVGHVPWNKGTHWTSGGRSAETRFRAGNRPHGWVPVGSLRINADGYLDRKVTDEPPTHKHWVPVHRLVWIEAHGPIPDGHAVCFKPGRRSTEMSAITVGALELVTRADLMRRNSVHNLPPELASLVQLRGALIRQINSATRREES